MRAQQELDLQPDRMLGSELLAVVGGIVVHVLLWRRRQPVAPFLAIAGACTFAAALTFGVQRYRLPFDVVLPVIAAVGISALLGRKSVRV